jgi:hypothetical protein
MSLLSLSAARRRAQRGTPTHSSVSSVLQKRVKKQASIASHDIFLSHAFNDRELILGVALMLEDLGFSVYLDWRDDPNLDRKNVNRDTVATLRSRIKSTRCLLFSTIENYSDSKWMPWELGYKDGHNTRAAILPIQDYEATSFAGEEYLGIYPYVIQQIDNSNRQRLWVHRSSSCYVGFDTWLDGEEPYDR